MTARLVEAGAAAVTRLCTPTWLGVDLAVVGPLELVVGDLCVVESRRTRNSIRGFVRPSVGPSVGPSVRQSVSH